MTDPVLGNAARRHSTSPLYGEDLTHNPLAYSGGPRLAQNPTHDIGQLVARAYVVTLHGGVILDASRHDL